MRNCHNNRKAENHRFTAGEMMQQSPEAKRVQTIGNGLLLLITIASLGPELLLL